MTPFLTKGVEILSLTEFDIESTTHLPKCLRKITAA